MRDVVRVIAKEGKYDLIVDKTIGGVMYVTKSVDITERVIKLYDKKKK
jgi:Skp family chaperone for outer membrane proteins